MLLWLGVSLHVCDVLFGWQVDDALAVSSRLASGICFLYEKVCRCWVQPKAKLFWIPSLIPPHSLRRYLLMLIDYRKKSHDIRGKAQILQFRH